MMKRRKSAKSGKNERRNIGVVLCALKRRVFLPVFLSIFSFVFLFQLLFSPYYSVLSCSSSMYPIND
jgi:hypothetical protein